MNAWHYRRISQPNVQLTWQILGRSKILVTSVAWNFLALMIQHARPHLSIIRASKFSYLCLPVTLFTKKLVYLIIQITNPKLTKSSCTNKRKHVSLNFSQCYNSELAGQNPPRVVALTEEEDNSRFQSSGIWCYVVEQVVSNISKENTAFKGNILLQHDGSRSPNSAVSHPTWLQPSKGSKFIKVKTDWYSRIFYSAIINVYWLLHTVNELKTGILKMEGHKATVRRLVPWKWKDIRQQSDVWCCGNCGLSGKPSLLCFQELREII